MSVNTIYNRPENSEKFTEFLCTIERNIKSQIDTIEGKINVEKVNEVILNAIRRANLFNKLPMVTYSFDKVIKNVNYNAVINNMHSIMKETMEYNSKGPVALDLDRIVHKIIEYKGLAGDKISSNSFAMWRELVQPELNSFMQSYMKSIIYSNFESDHIKVDSNQTVDMSILTNQKTESAQFGISSGIFLFIFIGLLMWGGSLEYKKHNKTNNKSNDTRKYKTKH